MEQRSELDVEMLDSVMAELESDNAPGEDSRSTAVAQQAATVLSPASAVAPVAADVQELERALADRDGQIAELQQAVVELAHSLEEGAVAAASPDIMALQERIAHLDARLAEQEHTMRHTLTMLIEWIEDRGNSQIAA